MFPAEMLLLVVSGAGIMPWNWNSAETGSSYTDHALYPISDVASTFVANESTVDASARLLPCRMNSAFMLDEWGVKYTPSDPQTKYVELPPFSIHAEGGL